MIVDQIALCLDRIVRLPRRLDGLLVDLEPGRDHPSTLGFLVAENNAAKVAAFAEDVRFESFFDLLER
jgi:hypothetical protein